MGLCWAYGPCLRLGARCPKPMRQVICAGNRPRPPRISEPSRCSEHGPRPSGSIRGCARRADLCHAGGETIDHPDPRGRTRLRGGEQMRTLGLVHGQRDRLRRDADMPMAWFPVRRLHGQEPGLGERVCGDADAALESRAHRIGKGPGTHPGIRRVRRRRPRVHRFARVTRTTPEGTAAPCVAPSRATSASPMDRASAFQGRCLRCGAWMSEGGPSGARTAALQSHASGCDGADATFKMRAPDGRT